MPASITLLGAARSGTKLLRDTLASADGIACVPYDVNYLWRFGNERSDHDEFVPASIDDRTAMKIRRLIERHGTGQSHLVEKTVGNSLRPAFVERVFPETTFVALVRNGYDVTESSMRQWGAGPDVRYLVSKSLTFPWLAAPGYAVRYAREVARGLTGNHSPSWGPRYRGMNDDIEAHTLAWVCAAQWAKCVAATLDAFAVTERPTTSVSYELFISEPAATLKGIADTCGIASRDFDVSGIRGGEVGKGRRSLDRETLEMIAPIIDPIHARVATATGLQLDEMND